jgi:hypothetical protein
MIVAESTKLNRDVLVDKQLLSDIQGFIILMILQKKSMFMGGTIHDTTKFHVKLLALFLIWNLI